jgi:hypothetical protein
MLPAARERSEADEARQSTGPAWSAPPIENVRLPAASRSSDRAAVFGMQDRHWRVRLASLLSVVALLAASTVLFLNFRAVGPAAQTNRFGYRLRTSIGPKQTLTVFALRQMRHPREPMTLFNALNRPMLMKYGILAPSQRTQYQTLILLRIGILAFFLPLHPRRDVEAEGSGCSSRRAS